MRVESKNAGNLFKLAQNIVKKRNFLQKSAFKSTPVSDVSLALLGNGIAEHLTGIPTGLIGTATGLLSDTGDNNQVNSGMLSLVPGVGSHRVANRLKTQAVLQDRKHGGKAKRNLIGEYIGRLTSAIAAGATGGAIGSLAGKLSKAKDGALRGGVGGAVAGLSLAGLTELASLATAAIKRRRTAEEQIEHDKEHRTSNWLVPGYASYNYYKRLGRSQGDRDENEQRKDRDSESEKSAESRRLIGMQPLPLFPKTDPAIKRAIIGGLITGAGSTLFSEGKASSRLLKALLAAGVGGLGTYALDRSGVADMALSRLKDLGTDAKSKFSRFIHS